MSKVNAGKVYRPGETRTSREIQKKKRKEEKTGSKIFPPSQNVLAGGDQKTLQLESIFFFPNDDDGHLTPSGSLDLTKLAHLAHATEKGKKSFKGERASLRVLGRPA